MAEQSTPNTFSAGMVTDLDPAYQSKESYFTGLNIRVITNGDKSFSIENIAGPSSKSSLNYTNRVHGAVIIEDYLIVIEKILSSNNITIRKYDLNSDGSFDGGESFSGTGLWTGAGLLSENCGKIEIESVVETENIHRIYFTDGITSLKTLNVKESTATINAMNVSDFEVFKPNLLTGVTLSDYNETGGGLKYGSYSYVYRLGSVNEGSYTDWSNISMPINIVKNSITNNTSLGVEGGSSGDVSSASLKLSIPNVSTSYETIQVASIHYTSENTQTINIIEEGSIVGTTETVTHTFTHSGFETETLVTGGIAAAIISNETWNTCKVLAQKDNKLFAGNLKSTSLDVDSAMESIGKLKSYRGSESGGTWTLETHSDDANPHRHYNGGSDNWSWDPNLTTDKKKYKFINYNFGVDAQNPVYVLGAETVGYSSGSDGFRMTFTQVDYFIDENHNASPTGSTSPAMQNDEQPANEIYTLSASYNNSSYINGKPGPHNPKWDNEFRSFKRGECYRFGVVFYDKQGNPGFTHHLGDIKMPDALDPNGKILNTAGDGVQDKVYNSQNSCWSPFSTPISGTPSVLAHALIPRLEVRLPSSITGEISGYKIVRAELTENDKIIITQGLLSHNEKHHTTESDNTDLAGKYGPQTAPYYPSEQDAGATTNPNGYPYRLAHKSYNVETPDVTLGNKEYLLGSGYMVRSLYVAEMNTIHGGSFGSNNYQYAGYKTKTEPDEDGKGGLHAIKYRVWPGFTNSSSGDSLKLNLQDSYGGYLALWAIDLKLGKTVVSGEEVSMTQNGIDRSYMHYTGQYDDDNPNQYNNQSDDDAAGGLLGTWWGQQSRAKWTGGAVDSLYITTDTNLPLLGKIENKTNDPSDVYSFHDIPGNDDGMVPWALSGNSNRSMTFLPYKYIVEIIRNTSNGFEQYGGDSPSAIGQTRFFDCTPYKDKAVTSISITGGDTYCDWYTYKNSWHKTEGAKAHNWASCVPLEMSMNTALRQGTYFGSGESTECFTQDSYLYNTAYSQENSLVGSTIKPSSWRSTDTFKAKIAASNTKIFGEITDSWTTFPANDFIELDLAQGQLTDLITLKNQLYAVQESGVSLLSINSRAIITGEGAAADIQIVTGTGTAIERYDYLTTHYGSQHFNEAIKTPSSFYVFDNDSSDIVKCDGQNITPIALHNNYKKFLSDITENKTIPTQTSSTDSAIGLIDKGVFSGYDNEFRECYYTIVNSLGAFNTFTFSDVDGKLISKLELRDHVVTSDILINKYLTYKNHFYGFSYEASNVNDKKYLLNSGVYQNFNVGFIVNDSPAINKVFDTSEILADTPLSDSTKLFTSHNLEDSLGQSQTVTSITSERIREGSHRLPLRNPSDSSPRLRGSWLKHTINYNQAATNGAIDQNNTKKFNIFAVNTRFRNSR